MDEFHQVLCPPERQDEFTKKMITELGFVGAKKVDGSYVGLMRLMFTIAICVGVTEHSPFTKRYCFEDITECLAQYKLLDDLQHEVSGYVATRG